MDFVGDSDRNDIKLRLHNCEKQHLQIKSAVEFSLLVNIGMPRLQR